MPRVGFVDMHRPRAFFNRSAKTQPASPDHSAQLPTQNHRNADSSVSKYSPGQPSQLSQTASVDTVVPIANVERQQQPQQQTAHQQYTKPIPKFSAAVEMERMSGAGSSLGSRLGNLGSEPESAEGEPLADDNVARNIPEDFKPKHQLGPLSTDGDADEGYTGAGMANGGNAGAHNSEDERASLPTPTTHMAEVQFFNRFSNLKQQPALRPRQFLQSNSSTTQDSQLLSSAASVKSYETTASSVHTLPPLQEKAAFDNDESLEPILEDDPRNFDLLVPAEKSMASGYSLETRSLELFSREHLQEIFDDSTLLLRFTSFLSTHRPQSVPLLIYYLDALKALRAINYANAIADALDPLDGRDFSQHPPRDTLNAILEEKASAAFDALVKDDLPAYITHTFIQTVTTSIQRRITGTLPPHLREASEGLAEVFCLTDPSRPDNPIVFASEEFHRTTQYGVSYAIGRNCRFLQGPNTNKYSVQRLGAAIKSGKEVCEVFLNYRRDGSPFMNLLMTAPLLDNRGNIRYFIGAQVDVSGLARDCSDLEGLQRYLAKKNIASNGDQNEPSKFPQKDAFSLLSEMLNTAELDIVRRNGGKMHREHVDEQEDSHQGQHRPRLLLKDPAGDNPSPHITNNLQTLDARQRLSGRLEGIYQNYLLVRPYPSLRILFSSPALRVPGILQSPFMSRIGGSARVRDELTAALAEGRGVTAKVRWVSGRTGDPSAEDATGRPRWIHCTPLLGHNGAVGVWMVVIVDDEGAAPTRRYRTAPPVATDVSAAYGTGPVSQNLASHRQMFDSTTNTPPSRSHSVLTDGERPRSRTGRDSVQPLAAGGLSKESFGL